MSAAAVAAATTAIAVTAGPAQAATQTFNLYSQVHPAFQPTPINHGSHSISLTVSPASAAAGDVIEVVVSSSTLAVPGLPASSTAPNTRELDAVITLDGVDYTLRGSQQTQTVPANDGTTPNTPELFQAGWSVSSTASNSSSTSSDGSAPPTITSGTSGIGATVRGAEATPVTLSAPGTPGTYPLTLKALVANDLSGGPSAVALTDLFDIVFSPANATVTTPATANNGPKNSFNNNVSSSYLTFSPTVDLTVT